MSNGTDIDQRCGGGLVIPPDDDIAFGAPAPLTDVRQLGDVSWLPAVRTGNDQGEDGACTLFALASWATVMHGSRISDYQRLLLYKETRLRLRRNAHAGLTPGEAFAAASSAGWLPGSTSIRRVGNLDVLRRQPILAGYAVTPGWDRRNVTFAGCLDHRMLTPERGLHMVQVVAAGQVDGIPGRWIYIENSWGRAWGWRGIGVMSADMHNALCKGLWVIDGGTHVK